MFTPLYDSEEQAKQPRIPIQVSLSGIFFAVTIVAILIIVIKRSETTPQETKVSSGVMVASELAGERGFELEAKKRTLADAVAWINKFIPEQIAISSQVDSSQQVTFRHRGTWPEILKKVAAQSGLQLNYNEEEKVYRLEPLPE